MKQNALRCGYAFAWQAVRHWVSVTFSSHNINVTTSSLPAAVQFC